MEYFDVLDKNGNLIGQRKLRTEVHKDGDWHRAAHIWVINSKGELLIQKRTITKDSFPGLWDVSSGGHILAGESIREAMMREAGEELGLNLEEKDFEYLFTITEQAVANYGMFVNNEFDEVYLVKLDLDVSQFHIQKEEIAEIKFVQFAELEKMIKERPEDFVPHGEQYKRLFELLRKI